MTDEPSRCVQSIRNTSRLEFQHAINPLARNATKMVQERRDVKPVFEIVEQRSHRHARATKHRLSSEFVRIN